MRKILQSRLFLSHLIKRSRILCQKTHFITKLQQIAGKRAVNAAQEIDMGCGKQFQILLGSFPVFLTFPVAYPSELQGRMVPREAPFPLFPVSGILCFLLLRQGSSLRTPASPQRDRERDAPDPTGLPPGRKRQLLFLSVRNSFCSSRYPSGPVSSSPIPATSPIRPVKRTVSAIPFSPFSPVSSQRRFLFISMLPVLPHFHSGQNAEGPQTPGLTPFCPQIP